jgi:phenylalanyl-tRNA synthetase beta chain
MKFTLSWLKDHLETDATLNEICERLTAIGLEVEDVDDKAAYQPFTIAKVVSAEQHPNADKLRVLMVDKGDGKPVQIVCGAPNARAGLVGALARTWHLCSGHRRHARGRQHPWRRKPRHDVLGKRARHVRRS